MARHLDSYLERIVHHDLSEMGLVVRRPEGVMAWLRAYAAATGSTCSWEKIRTAATNRVDAPPARSTDGAGAVSCRGQNGKGQLGDGTTTSSIDPVDVLDVAGATALATGSDHSCALVADGGVMCWGFNRSGQVGNGTTSEAPPSDAVIVSF